MAEIRQFFRTNETPIYFISPTAFNLLGIDRWVRNFFYVTSFDSFEGGHPRVVVPTDRTHREFTSIEDVYNELSVATLLAAHQPRRDISEVRRQTLLDLRRDPDQPVLDPDLHHAGGNHDSPVRASAT
jgi:hypothetical protein